MSLAELLPIISTLSDSERLELMNLLIKQFSEQSPQGYVQIQKEKPISRKDLFGIWRGEIWMANDFDAPLDDMQEYMW